VAIVDGDAKCRSIAAASIVAKVTRDRIMVEYAREHPGYGWETNKGYPTPEHQRALRALGPTPLHRRSFAPVRQLTLDLIASEPAAAPEAAAMPPLPAS
jgi:ribonuclease HII